MDQSYLSYSALRVYFEKKLLASDSITKPIIYAQFTNALSAKIHDWQAYTLQANKKKSETYNHSVERLTASIAEYKRDLTFDQYKTYIQTLKCDIYNKLSDYYVVTSSGNRMNRILGMPLSDTSFVFQWYILMNNGVIISDNEDRIIFTIIDDIQIEKLWLYLDSQEETFNEDKDRDIERHLNFRYYPFCKNFEAYKVFLDSIKSQREYIEQYDNLFNYYDSIYSIDLSVWRSLNNERIITPPKYSQPQK